MKAAQISEYGQADKIHITEIDKPTVGEGQVLVEVHAASLNPFDTAVREGYVKQMIPNLPVTLGGDFAGIVAEVGKGVSHVVIGDKVYGQANTVAGSSGSLAEFAQTKTTQVSKMPSNITFEEAASLPLVASSAYQALIEHLDIKSGQRLFIHGGSGGIGLIAIQIAKHIGAFVSASSRPDGQDSVKNLGTDEIIDTETRDFKDLKDFDAVLDTVGGEDFIKLFSILKPGGKAVSMIAQVDKEKANMLEVKALSQSTHVTTEKLDAISRLVEAGAIKSQVGMVFTLEQIREAFEARESGKVNGKVVIKI